MTTRSGPYYKEPGRCACGIPLEDHNLPTTAPCEALEVGGKAPIFYECGICGAYHPWEWDGDCRDDANRLQEVPDYAEVRSMEDRVEADERGES